MTILIPTSKFIDTIIDVDSYTMHSAIYQTNIVTDQDTQKNYQSVSPPS